MNRRGRIVLLYYPFHTRMTTIWRRSTWSSAASKLHDKFFASTSQLHADIVRVLHYTGLRFNFYDVSCCAGISRSSRNRRERPRSTFADGATSLQAPQDFEMSVRNSSSRRWGPRARPKIQGLLNDVHDLLDDEFP